MPKIGDMQKIMQETTTTDTNPNTDDALKAAVAEFIGAFEEVFGRDWTYTRSALTLINPATECFIRTEGTFLEPGVSDEAANWVARGALLAKYRRLCEVMWRLGLEPKPLFPHTEA